MKQKILLFLFVFLIFSNIGCVQKTSGTGNVKQQNSQGEKTVKENQMDTIVSLIEDDKYNRVIELWKNYERDNNDIGILKKYAKALQNRENGHIEDEILVFTSIPDSYDGALSNQIRQDKYKAITILINNNEYEKAMDILNSAGLFSLPNRSETYKTLLWYLKYLCLKGPNEFYYLSQIPVDYNGPLSDKINHTLIKYNSEINKDADKRKKTEIILSSESKKEPKIGMTKEEVLNSLWGKPHDINKTTTEYSTHEQWVYSLDRYVYFDDGVVTGIQE